MKKTIALVGMLVSMHVGHAQAWVGLGTGGHLNDIRFTNSAGIKDTRIKGIPAAYASFFFGYDLGGNKKTTDSKTALVLESGFKKGSSKNKESSTLETWVIDNLSTTLSVRRLFQSRSLVNPYVGAGLSADMIIGAIQQEGFEQYDLSNDLKTLNIGVLAEVGITYFIAHEIYGTLGATYINGLSNLEKTEGQTAKISGVKIGIAVFFQLK